MPSWVDTLFADVMPQIAGVPRTPSARTPGFNPNARTPRVPQGTLPAPQATYPAPAGMPMPSPAPTSAPAPGASPASPQQQGLLANIFGGFSDPRAATFLMTLANALTAPRAQGQSDVGALVNGITGGYSALGVQAQLARKQQIEEEQRKIENSMKDRQIKVQESEAASQQEDRVESRKLNKTSIEGRLEMERKNLDLQGKQLEQQQKQFDAKYKQDDAHFLAQKARWDRQDTLTEEELKYKKEHDAAQLKLNQKQLEYEGVRARAAMLQAVAADNRSDKDKLNMAAIIEAASKAAIQMTKDDVAGTIDPQAYRGALRGQLDLHLKAQQARGNLKDVTVDKLLTGVEPSPGGAYPAPNGTPEDPLGVGIPKRGGK